MLSVTDNKYKSILNPNGIHPSQGGGGGISAILGASFDGTNDYLKTSGDLDGNADGKTGIFATRIRFNAGDGVLQRIMFSFGGRFDADKTTGNLIDLIGTNTSGVVVMRVQSTTNTLQVADGYVTVLGAWDLAATTVQLYINDSVDENTVTATDENIDYTTAGNYGFLARDNGSNKCTADCTFLYINTAEYLDISVEANRRKFFDASNLPVDMGSDGSTPTGTAPIVFLQGEYGSWDTNLGTGGALILTGALTEPID